MTKARLEGMPLKSLLELCRKEYLDVDPHLPREDIIETLLEAYEEDRRERETLKNLIIKIEESKFALYHEDFQEPQTYAPAALPDHYDETKVGLLLRDPNWAFVFWEVRQQDQDVHGSEPQFRGYSLRVYELETPDDHGNVFFMIPLDGALGSRYINLPTPARYYYLELHALNDKESRMLARSGTIFSPSDSPSYVLAENDEGRRQKKLLELSGLSICESRKQESPDEPSPESQSPPQRIGDMDESLFLDAEASS